MLAMLDRVWSCACDRSGLLRGRDGLPEPAIDQALQTSRPMLPVSAQLDCERPSRPATWRGSMMSSPSTARLPIAVPMVLNAGGALASAFPDPAPGCPSRDDEARCRCRCHVRRITSESCRTRQRSRSRSRSAEVVPGGACGRAWPVIHTGITRSISCCFASC